ncbi:MAG: DinB family protein [Chloroflexia bacterium]|nr:DinB family protein [Chloroflexia bacterium]
MATPPRLTPLLAQFDFARESLTECMVGLTDDEYLWEPAPGATELVGAGDWGRDRSLDDPEPAPFTTLAWRLGHLSETMAMRADYTIGKRSLTRTDYRFSGDAAGALAAFAAALDMVGRSTYPNGSDPHWPFIDVVWWENQELLHHRAEIALMRDLYRARHESNVG